MRARKEAIIPYESYVTLGIVVFIIILMILFKLTARNNIVSSGLDLHIYSQPETNPRKRNANKNQRKNTSLASKSMGQMNPVPTSN